MRIPESTPEQRRTAAMNVGARMSLEPDQLRRLAYYADGDESLMEEALRPSCESGTCSVWAAEQHLCLRMLPVE